MQTSATIEVYDLNSEVIAGTLLPFEYKELVDSPN